MINPATALAFSMFENKGVYALLLGSGVSRAAEIPTGWEIVLELVRRVGALEGVPEQLDWAVWHQERFGEPPNYSKLLDALSQTSDERRSILHRFIDPTPKDLEEGRRTPTRAHRAIARMVRDGYVRVIVTTNFDRLLENALREVGVEPVVIKSDDDLVGAAPLIHIRCLILKVHGDYMDTRLRNTEGELDAYSGPLNIFLDRILDEHGLITCGWSGDWDTALRSAITRSPSRRYPLYWASRRVPAPETPASDLLAARAGRWVEIDDADTFFDRLASDLETQATLMRPNPLSLELLVATAKRYLGRAEHRIALSDLLRDEFDRARGLVKDAAFEAGGSLDYAEFRRRIERYDAIYEGLVRILYALGRWGDGADTQLATDILRTLTRRDRASGQVMLIELPTYPAVLALYGYGIGLLQAGRLGDLYRWLRLPVRNGRREDAQAAVENLFLWDWGSGAEDYFKSFPDLKDRKTAMSDHLHGLLAGWLSRDFLAGRSFDVAFDVFELSATFAFLDAKGAADQIKISTNRRDPVRAPVGRIAWQGEDRQSEVFDALTSRETRASVLAAGFAGGDEEDLNHLVANIWQLFQYAR